MEPVLASRSTDRTFNRLGIIPGIGVASGLARCAYGVALIIINKVHKSNDDGKKAEVFKAAIKGGEFEIALGSVQTVPITGNIASFFLTYLNVNWKDLQAREKSKEIPPTQKNGISPSKFNTEASESQSA